MQLIRVVKTIFLAKAITILFWGMKFKNKSRSNRQRLSGA